MHISKLSLINYRNFSNSKLLFSKGINTIIGENASGKTNVFRAIRLLLDSSMSRSAYQLSEADICRDLPNWRGHWVIISITFDDISDDEVSQSLFLHGTGNIESAILSQATCNLIFRPKSHIRHALSELLPNDLTAMRAYLETISIDDYETVLTGRSNADFNDKSVYSKIVGNFDTSTFPSQTSQEDIGTELPRLLKLSSEVSLTFVKALRDVVSDFQNNRRNPLLTLLNKKSGKIAPSELSRVTTAVKDLNLQIESLSDVSEVRNDIESTINNSAGDTYSPHSLSIKSGISSEENDLFKSLKLFVDESANGHEGAIHEMSLGGANLIFLTLKLLEFSYQKEYESIANFLLIEEPEAHIHTHIQKSLFDKISYLDTQIIYSTHSSHISAVCKIQNVNIIGKVDGKCEVFQPAQGLTLSQVTYVERYLDAIRSNLLFAKSVILVEGDAEEILVPVLIKKALGLSLDELGISLVNIRSTGFENVALLFHDERIRKKCSIITDLDSRFYDITPKDDDSEAITKQKSKARGSEESGAARKVAIDALCQNNNWLRPLYADHTFEVDFIKAGNQNTLLTVVNDVYTDPAKILETVTQIQSDDIATSGQRVMKMAAYKKKGWFALTLAEKVTIETNVPQYIIDAVLFSHGTMQPNILEKIIKYRLLAIYNYAIETAKSSGLNTDLQAITDGIKIFAPKWKSYLESRRDENEIHTIKQAFVDDIPFHSSNILRDF